MAADLALSMPAKSRLDRFKIALSASFGVVRRAPLIHKAAIRCTFFRGVNMHCLFRAVHHRATPYSWIGLTTDVYIQLNILGDMLHPSPIALLQSKVQWLLSWFSFSFFSLSPQISGVIAKGGTTIV